MKRVMDVGRRFLREEDGIAVTEYGLLIAVLGIGLLGAVKYFGPKLVDWVKAATDKFVADASK